MFSGARRFANHLRMGFAGLLVMVLCLSAPLGASAAGASAGTKSGNAQVSSIVRAANIVARIVPSPRSPNILLLNQKLTFTFFYNTTWSMGVIVRAFAYTGTALTTGAKACGTAVLPVGHGTGTCTMSFATGGVAVNSIRFRMLDSTGKTVLFDAAMPVNYRVLNLGTQVSSLVLTPASPNIQLLAKGISVHFNYRTNQTGGVRIFAVPYTGTAPTPNFATCASTIYPAGSGTGTCRFTVASGATQVSSVHVQVWNAAQTQMLAELVIPVFYRFITQATMVTNTTLTPITPNIVRLGDNVAIHFLYQTDQSAGIVVEAVPFTGTTPTANATTAPSAVLPVGSGKGSCTFMITAGTNVTVSLVRLQAWDATHTTVLFTSWLPVQYQFH